LSAIARANLCIDAIFLKRPYLVRDLIFAATIDSISGNLASIARSLDEYIQHYLIYISG